MSTEDTISVELDRALRRIWADIMPRPARYRYFEHRQRMYCWSVEPVEGKFHSWVYVPYGKGARSGEAERWKMTDRREHRLRRQAKARALHMWEGAKAS